MKRICMVIGEKETIVENFLSNIEEEKIDIKKIAHLFTDAQLKEKIIQTVLEHYFNSRENLVLFGEPLNFREERKKIQSMANKFQWKTVVYWIDEEEMLGEVQTNNKNKFEVPLRKEGYEKIIYVV